MFGIHSGTACRGLFEARMMQRGSDVSRLLDRLEATGLIARRRSLEDKRSVLTVLTDKGWKLIDDSHAPLLSLNRDQFKGWSGQDLSQSTHLLKRALVRPDIDPNP